MSQSQIHIQNLFPTPLMHVEAILDQDSIRKITAGITQHRQQKNVNSKLLTHSEAIHPDGSENYRDLTRKTLPFLRDFGFLLFGENLTWSVKEMWTNIMTQGGHQSMHSHANSFISGIVFLSDCHPSARTVFHRGMGLPCYVFSNNHAESADTPYNSDRWVPSAIDRGDMILFPSYMLHAVPPNEGGERITLAFNATPDRLKSWDYEISF